MFANGPIFIEVFLFLGGSLCWGLWELRSLSKLRKAREAAERAVQANSTPHKR